MATAILEYPQSNAKFNNITGLNNRFDLDTDALATTVNAGLYVKNGGSDVAYMRLSANDVFELKQPSRGLLSFPANNSGTTGTVLSTANLSDISDYTIARSKLAAGTNANYLLVNDGSNYISEKQYVDNDLIADGTINTAKLNVSALTQDQYLKIDSNGAIVSAAISSPDVGFVDNSLTTTNATETIIYENSAFPDNSVSYIKVILTCQNASTQDSAFFDLVYKVKKGAAAATPTYVQQKNENYKDENFNVSFDVQSAADTFNIRAIGIAATTLKWVSRTVNINVA